MSDPIKENVLIRQSVDSLLGSLGMDGIETVRNTIFPAGIARRFPEPSDLALYYRHTLYPRVQKFPGNRGGTYFGRIVAYPRADGTEADQLSDTVAKLRKSRKGTRMSSTYEINIYHEQKDHSKRMAFPCLSYCSFHLEGDKLLMAAFYRSHYLVQRAYGNYLGLGELQNYIALASGFETGELLVVSGHATVEKGAKKVRDLLKTLRIDSPP